MVRIRGNIARHKNWDCNPLSANGGDHENCQPWELNLTPPLSFSSLTGATPATLNYFRVIATDDSFNESAPSDAASAATAGTLGVGFIYDSNGDLIGSTETQEGQSFTLDLTEKFAAGTTDPAASGWNIDWGDGHGETEGAGAGSYSHAYDEPGNYTITASTLDGTFAGTATDQVDIADGALSLTETDDRSSGTFSGTATLRTRKATAPKRGMLIGAMGRTPAWAGRPAATAMILARRRTRNRSPIPTPRTDWSTQ